VFSPRNQMTNRYRASELARYLSRLSLAVVAH